MITFRVDGIPIPQGSKVVARGGGKVWLRDANASRLKPWRQRVAAASDVGETFDCPVMVVAVFYLPVPKRPRWFAPAVKPDTDKLCRALLDGMTDGGLLSDDARVVDLIALKRYATVENPIGVAVSVVEVKEHWARPDRVQAVVDRLNSEED